MPDHFVEIVFAVLSGIFLTLYVHDTICQKDGNRLPRKAWLRTGLIFAVVSMLLFYLH